MLWERGGSERGGAEPRRMANTGNWQQRGAPVLDLLVIDAQRPGHWFKSGHRKFVTRRIMKKMGKESRD